MFGNWARRADAAIASRSTSQPDEALPSGACWNALEDTGLSPVGVEFDVCAPSAVVHPTNSSRSILGSAHLVLEKECTIRRHCFSQRAIGGAAANFEGDVLEESILGIGWRSVISPELGAVGEFKDVAVAVLDTEIIVVTANGIGEVFARGARWGRGTFAVQPDHAGSAAPAGLRGLVADKYQAWGAASSEARCFILRPPLASVAAPSYEGGLVARPALARSAALSNLSVLVEPSDGPWSDTAVNSLVWVARQEERRGISKASLSGVFGVTDSNALSFVHCGIGSDSCKDEGKENSCDEGHC